MFQMLSPPVVVDGPGSILRFERELGTSPNKKSAAVLFLGHLVYRLCPSFLICKTEDDKDTHLGGWLQVFMSEYTSVP